MAEYAINLNNGKTDEKGIFRFLSKAYSQSGAVEAAALTVAAQSSPDMTVKVSGSSASDNAVFITATDDFYAGWNTASYNVTIAANATGATRYDAIVAYIDTAAGSSTANNPGGLKFIAVRSTNTSPALTSDITSSAVGSKPYIRLADVLVGAGVTSINSGNITDTRPVAASKLTSPQATAPLTLATGSQETGKAAWGGYINGAGGVVTVTWPFKSVMTNIPSSVTLSGASYSNCGTLTYVDATKYYFRFSVTATTTSAAASVTFDYVTNGN